VLPGISGWNKTTFRIGGGAGTSDAESLLDGEAKEEDSG
jgi:hypothetical protein